MGMKLITAVAVSTVIMGVATAFSHPLSDDMQPPPPRPHHQMDGCCPCPPPDEATREKIEQLMDQEMEKMEPVIRKLQEARRTLRKTAMQKPFDEQKVRAAASELGKIETELTVARLRTQARIAELTKGKHEKK